jgi:hypothetical protein
MMIAHRNNIRDDNRLENLQILSNQENSRKSLTYSSNTSGYQGISKTRSNTWSVAITDDNSKYIRKNFLTLHSALIYRKYMEIVELKYPQVQKVGYKPLY